ncbi:MAG: hypothetical protein MRZ79_19595 [Bacteroidia bacterium]|nr:hypothetical protein [Bacteroidia bacterium]
MKKIIITVTLLSWCLGAMGQFKFSNDAPKVGEKINIEFEKEIDQLIITYRPNSAVEKNENIAIVPASKTVEWTPQNPGVVAISYSVEMEESQGPSMNISVRYNGLSYEGIIVMIAAGLILFGGAFVAFRTLFRDEEEDGTRDLDPDQLPDT